MAEASCSYHSDDEKDISIENIESDEESLPQHDLDAVPCTKTTFCKKPEESERLLDNQHSPPSSLGHSQPSGYERKDEIKTKKEDRKENMSSGKKKLYSWLNKQMKIEMTDGRVLVGIFLCTDRDANVILGSCTEYLNPEVCGFTDEPRILGLVMVPGRHIVSIHHDASDAPSEEKEIKEVNSSPNWSESLYS
ncbi:N-alpha-acetyltransferase 38-B, NatC auxiliary subunit [Halyomorpha halys]|uniref:N-alpha-acetyltransferase 38-B, NatC auxiliary subunit n=1 Tax=Halyomorpha halys TaxID=286706 RepID=UPI0006D4FAC2|nr:N-alpha-acetyltransferase 38-B, NatC auxiliary subunit [Halyomorpha halys]